MSDKTISVNAKALEELLRAVLGPPHHVRELHVTRGLPGFDNCIDILQREFNAAIAAPVVERQPVADAVNLDDLPAGGYHRLPIDTGESSGLPSDIKEGCTHPKGCTFCAWCGSKASATTSRALVLPEWKNIHAMTLKEWNKPAQDFASGWNACRDKVKELNP